MKLLLDSFWRAIAYLLLPRVIALSVMPVLIASALAMGLGWLYWEQAVDTVNATLQNWSLAEAVLKWLDSTVGPRFRLVLAPLLIVALALPVVVFVSVLLVAWMMTPTIVGVVHDRRFATLERRHGAAAWRSVLWSLGCTFVALLAMVVTAPLWLIPPLVLILPPLIWGWLTKQVMSFDVLADHASATERRAVLKEHRWPLLVMGVVTGYLGAAPSLIWALGAVTVALAPLLVPVSIWLYTLVFAFSALWFAHYGLAALQVMRAASVVELVPLVPDGPATMPHSPDPSASLPPA